MTLRLEKLLLSKTPASAVVQSFLVKVMLIVINLVCSVITARSLGPLGRGEQSAILIWPYLVTGLLSFGIPSALNYYTSRSVQQEGALLSAASILLIFTGLFGGAVASAIVPQYLANYSQHVVYAARVLLLFSPIALLGNLFQENLEARGDFTRSNGSRMYATIGTLIGIVLLVSFHRLTPFTAALAVYVPLTAQTVMLGTNLLNRFSSDYRVFVRSSRTLLSYGLPAFGTGILYTFSSQIDQAMIIRFLSPSALGVYAIALTASRTLNILMQSLMMVFLPRASRLDPEAAVDLIARVSRVSTALTSVCAVVLFALIPLLMPLFFGKAFSGAVPVTRVLIFETLLMGAALALADAFSAIGRPGIVTILQAIWIAASVVSLIVLVPRFGTIGAAYALVMSSLVRLIATLASYPLLLHRSVPPLYPSGDDIRQLLSRISSQRQ